jgi:hypothetical protein
MGGLRLRKLSQVVIQSDFEGFVGAYARDRGAPCSRQRFTLGDEPIEAAPTSGSSVFQSRTCESVRCLSKCENLDCREIVHAERGNRLRFLCGDEAQKQPPTVPRGLHGVEVTLH